MKLIGLVGNNSKKSTNRTLLQFVQKHFADKADIELVEIKDIPLFNKPAKKAVPPIVEEIAAKIDAADGVIIASPEYDHAVPAALMNALAWLSYGIYPLLNKPVMLMGASYGALGSSRAQLQLRQMLASPEVQAAVSPGEFLLSRSLQAFDADGNLHDIEIVQKLEGLFNDFRLYVKITGKLSNAHALLHKEAENFDWENI